MDIISQNSDLIAPCGMNCGLCDKYLAYSHKIPKIKGKINHCQGCRPLNKQCSFIKKNCDTLKSNKIEFCFECIRFPCDTLVKIDKGYYNRYKISLIKNLKSIQEKGLDDFLKNEKTIHSCQICGDTVCIHNNKCYSCNNKI